MFELEVKTDKYDQDDAYNPEKNKNYYPNTTYLKIMDREILISYYIGFTVCCIICIEHNILSYAYLNNNKIDKNISNYSTHYDISFNY